MGDLTDIESQLEVIPLYPQLTQQQQQQQQDADEVDGNITQADLDRYNTN